MDSVDDDENLCSDDLLRKLAGDVTHVLSRFGTLAPGSGDYWVDRINLSIPSVEVLIFYKDENIIDLLMECSTLLDSYPENFRIRFIEADKAGKPLEPLGGLCLNRYGPESIE